jgi:hypothetical protein
MPARKAGPRFRPQLETLEGRDVPSFGAPVAYGSGEPVALVTGDVNGDGKPDLITITFTGNSIAVRLNNGKGTGTFGAPIGASIGGPLGATALAVGPHLGKPTIYVASYDPGNGTGGMTSFSFFQLTKKGTLIEVGGWASNPPIDASLSSIALADLNGDGQTDLVAVPDDGGNVYVFRGSSGGFSSVQNYYVPSTLVSSVPAQVAVGDVNGDGKPDIVMTSPGLSCVSVLLNKGNGTFGTAQSYAVGGVPTAVAVGDVSGDGKLDVVTTNSNGTVSMLLGPGNGTFGAAQNYAIGGPANSVVLGDFNHDGHLDIATTGSKEMDLLLNNGSGTFAAYQKIGPAGSSVVAADFNGDGYLDLAEIDASPNTIDVLLNQANR